MKPNLGRQLPFEAKKVKAKLVRRHIHVDKEKYARLQII